MISDLLKIIKIYGETMMECYWNLYFEIILFIEVFSFSILQPLSIGLIEWE